MDFGVYTVDFGVYTVLLYLLIFIFAVLHCWPIYEYLLFKIVSIDVKILPPHQKI